MRRITFVLLFIGALIAESGAQSLEGAFVNPPHSARPGAYWTFNDGNLNREEMVKDLESVAEAGLGSLSVLEVQLSNILPGPVEYLSDEWQDLFVHIFRKAEKLGIDITMLTGPGWSGCGGPWVPVENSMQSLVHSEVEVEGPGKFDGKLPLPEQRIHPYHLGKSDFYEDVFLMALPSVPPVLQDIERKALYVRYPYSSNEKAKPYLPSRAEYPEAGADQLIKKDQIIDLTGQLTGDGQLTWNVPEGKWTIIRFGRRSTGAVTRFASAAGIGFDVDKFDRASLENHFEKYLGGLLTKAGPRRGDHGWKSLYHESWEIGSQNWSPVFINEFKNRRGYDPVKYFIAFTGRAVESQEVSERFLWDVRMTAQELVLEYYASPLKELSNEQGLEFIIEPYDMNPASDLNLGAVADVPMCEFWSWDLGFNTIYSCLEATSIAHVMGRPVVAAESFTANQGQDDYMQYPWSMKNQGDWALCMGINRIMFHVFAHQPLGKDYRPGLTYGPYGVHHDRGQTWWHMSGDYHRYITRVQHLMQQGVMVSDLLYLAPEGAPNVFTPPPSALTEPGPKGDKKGYGFDGCSPELLMERARVKNGSIVFEGGTSYKLLVLPQFQTMTPELLRYIRDLVNAGATVVGSPPAKSPGLENYPDCDKDVLALSKDLWGGLQAPETVTRRSFGKGAIYWGGDLSPAHMRFPFSQVSKAVSEEHELYPSYELTTELMRDMGIREDFSAEPAVIRYGHRSAGSKEIYFVSNRQDREVEVQCTFRVGKAQPQLWDPVTGEIRLLPEFKGSGGVTTVPMNFAPYQSFLVVFDKENKVTTRSRDTYESSRNFPGTETLMEIDGSWNVSFDPEWGPFESTGNIKAGEFVFDGLPDWTSHPHPGIKYYSGTATYRNEFEYGMEDGKQNRIFLNLGRVHDMARVRLNGKDLGVVWCAPWQLEVTDYLRNGRNELEIEVVNRWVNRMLGDMETPDKDARKILFEDGYLGGKEYSTGRYTFTTAGGIDKRPLLPSGLIGPVRIRAVTKEK